MNIEPIKADRDYRRTLEEIEGLMTAERDTPEGDRLDVLVTLVEAWETRHYPIDLPDPIAAIRYHMEQNGLSPKDLAPCIGGRDRVYEGFISAHHNPLSYFPARRRCSSRRAGIVVTAVATRARRSCTDRHPEPGAGRTTSALIFANH